MKRYTQILQQYIKTQPVSYGGAEMDSVLEMLYQCYAEENITMTPEERANWDVLGEFLESLPIEENNRMTFAICRLCTERESAAFEKGVIVGAKIMMEIMEDD